MSGQGKSGGGAPRGAAATGGRGSMVRLRDGRAVKPTERNRIIASTVDVVSTIGFGQAKVADIIATARVARRTFWGHFTGKAEAVAAAYEQITGELRQTVQEAHDRQSGPVERIEASLTALAVFLAADPPRAEVLLVQGPAAGRAVMEVRAQSLEHLAGLLSRAIAEVEGASAARVRDRPAVVAESLAGGLYEVAYVRTFHGEVRELPGLVPELVQTVLAPYRSSVA